MIGSKKGSWSNIPKKVRESIALNIIQGIELLKQNLLPYNILPSSLRP